jgi:hypothetical protein
MLVSCLLGIQNDRGLQQQAPAAAASVAGNKVQKHQQQHQAAAATIETKVLRLKGPYGQYASV